MLDGPKSYRDVGVWWALGLFISLCFTIMGFITFSDPFADATKDDNLLPVGTEDKIHIKTQQWTGDKILATVQGIADDYDKKKLVKAFKKVTIKEENFFLSLKDKTNFFFFFNFCKCIILNWVIWFGQEFACDGPVIRYPEYGEVIQLKGDQKKKKNLLVSDWGEPFLSFVFVFLFCL